MLDCHSDFSEHLETVKTHNAISRVRKLLRHFFLGYHLRFCFRNNCAFVSSALAATMAVLMQTRTCSVRTNAKYSSSCSRPSAEIHMTLTVNF
jgi:hypothetical protein